MDSVVAAAMYTLAALASACLLVFVFALSQIYDPTRFRRDASAMLLRAVASAGPGLEVQNASDAFWRHLDAIAKEAEPRDGEADQQAALERLGLIVAHGRLEADAVDELAAAATSKRQQVEVGFRDSLERSAAISMHGLLRSGRRLVWRGDLRLRWAGLLRYGPPAVAVFQTTERRVFKWLGISTLVVVLVTVVLGHGDDGAVSLSQVNDLGSTLVTLFLALWVGIYVVPTILRFRATLDLPPPTRRGQIGLALALACPVIGIFAIGIGWMTQWQRWSMLKTQTLIDGLQPERQTQIGAGIFIALLVWVGVRQVRVARSHVLGDRPRFRCLPDVALLVVQLPVYAVFVAICSTLLVGSASSAQPLLAVFAWVFLGAVTLATLLYAVYAWAILRHLKARRALLATRGLRAGVAPAALVVGAWLAAWPLWIVVAVVADATGNSPALTVVFFALFPGAMIGLFGAVIHGVVQHRMRRSEARLLDAEFDRRSRILPG